MPKKIWSSMAEPSVAEMQERDRIRQAHYVTLAEERAKREAQTKEAEIKSIIEDLQELQRLQTLKKTRLEELGAFGDKRSQEVIKKEDPAWPESLKKLQAIYSGKPKKINKRKKA